MHDWTRQEGTLVGHRDDAEARGAGRGRTNARVKSVSMWNAITKVNFSRRVPMLEATQMKNPMPKPMPYASSAGRSTLSGSTSCGANVVAILRSAVSRKTG